MADSLMHLNLDDEEIEKYVERKSSFLDLFKEVEPTPFEKMFKIERDEKEK
jgi:hypothetical protein